MTASATMCGLERLFSVYNNKREVINWREALEYLRDRVDVPVITAGQGVDRSRLPHP